MSWYSKNFSAVPLATKKDEIFITNFRELYNGIQNNGKLVLCYSLKSDNQYLNIYYAHIPKEQEKYFENFIRTNFLVPCEQPDFGKIKVVPKVGSLNFLI